MPTAFDDEMRLQSTKRLLARTPFIQNACDLDLILFLHRHPRMLLTSERLAELVGYNLKEIAKSLDSFIDAGVLERTQQSTHAARLFVLTVDGPHVGGVRTLLDLGSTRQGRRFILDALRERGPRPGEPGPSSVLRLTQCA
jgi:hypothetical protein